MTDCESCRLAEMSRNERLVETLARMTMCALGLGPSRQTRHLQSMMSGMSGVMLAAIGGKPRTWYDRHREAYEASGDPAELTRMLRHIDA